MYTKSKEKLGQYEVIRYKSDYSYNEFSIIPGYGAIINSLIFKAGSKKYSIIDGLDNSDVDTNPAYKSTILAPFPNRIEGGKYNFQDKTYQLPINEVALNNALHGFLFNRPFEIIKETILADSVKLVLQNKFPGGFPGYPFAFTMQLELTFSDSEGLNCAFSMENNSKSDIPVGYGWHPYFKFDCSIDELTLQLPACRKYELTDKCIPTGTMLEYDDFKKFRSMAQKKLDDCFKLDLLPDKVNTIIRKPSDNVEIVIWQENKKNTYNYLQVYTPPARKSIAVEPMTCCINAFNNKEGLLILKPGEKTSAAFGVVLRKYE